MIRKAVFVLLLLAGAVHAASIGKATVSASLNYKSLPPGQQAVVAVVVDVPAGFHSQSHTPSAPNYIAFKVTMDANPAVEWSEPVYPQGKDESYPGLGTLNVYTGQVVVYVPMQVQANAPAGPLKLTGTVVYQLCDANACYAPQRPTIEAGCDRRAGGGKCGRRCSAVTTDRPSRRRKRIGRSGRRWGGADRGIAV